MNDIWLNPGSFERMTGLFCFCDSLLGQVDIEPARETIIKIPLALPMT